MTKGTQYRVLVFDDDETIRNVLWQFFDNRGYEVFTFPHPRSCPLCDITSCICPIDTACSDIIMTDLEMPYKKGIEFLEDQISKGCKCHHLALMSGNLTENDYQRATAHGIQVFRKPFRISDVEKWVNSVEQEIPLSRKLADWFMGK